MANCLRCNKECKPNHYRINLITIENRRLNNVDVCSEACANELIQMYVKPHSDAIYEMLEQPIIRLR